MALLLIPVALLGVPQSVIAVVAPLHLFAQYWYHTQLIGKMGFLEKIIVTPSHHRVHHAINPAYMDKNLSEVFIVWDKLFGTFQEERADVPPVYGVKRPVRSWNPFVINFTHLWLLAKDAWRTNSWAAKAKIWFMPTGWRPADVAAKYPVTVIEDVYQYEKYDPKLSPWLKAWVWAEFGVVFVMAMHLFNNFAAIGFPGVLAYGGFCLYTIFSYSFLMDRQQSAGWAAFGKAVLGMVLLNAYGGWFAIDQALPGGSLAVGAYFVFSLVVSLGFVYWEIRPAYRAQAQPVA